MSDSELELQVFLYGPNEKRLEVLFTPRFPPQYKNNPTALELWAKQYSLTLGYDVKHTENWKCEVCGKPSRETMVQSACWPHATPGPKMVLYIHNVCNTYSRCGDQINAMGSLAVAAATGNSPRQSAPPTIPGRPPITDPDVVFPLAASCIKCTMDETAEDGYPMFRCTSCHLTRYCGKDCQREDWPRHKKVCKNIKSHRFVNF